MNRNLLIYLFASIVIVCAQNDTTTTSSSSTGNSTESTSVPTTSTTSKPSTSTTALPTTTAAPKTSTITTTTPGPTPGPIPKAEQWTGNLTEGNKTCINLQFSVQILINYNTSNKNEAKTGFTIPVNATVDPKLSHCRQPNKTEEVITITFDKQQRTSANLTLTFNKTGDDSYVDNIWVSFVATEELMPGFNPKLYGKALVAEASGLSLFKVSSDHSYLCSAVQSANLNSQGEVLNNVQILFTDSKVEAYIKESNKGKFDIESDCKSADISDVVPIAVGAALAGLVIIVLIAYFVGRRRSRRLAYQSV